MRVVTVALGKIGLPLAVHIARAGHDVVGCDIDERVVTLVNEGTPPFPNEAGLPEALGEVVGAGRLRAVLDTTAAVAEGPDLIVAVPPLYVDEAAQPAWSSLDSAIEAIGRGLRPGATVVIETTVPVGSTRGRFAVGLERASGLTEGRDFWLAFSPERVFSGRVFEDLARYPKLVGGLSPEGEQRAVELYRSFISADVWGMGSAEAAEMAKLVETTYRDVNIALANEFARAADARGLDIDRLIAAANSQPFSHVHRPGVAVGGHCIPVYPRFFLSGAPLAALPAAARAVNDAMPAYAVDLLGDVRGKRVLILGVAYRGGVKETAFSGAFSVRDELVARGATPVAADPLYAAEELRAHGFTPWDGERVEAGIVQADHPEYRELRPGSIPGLQRVVDGRGILDASAFSAAGVVVERIGRPPLPPP